MCTHRRACATAEPPWEQKSAEKTGTATSRAVVSTFGKFHSGVASARSIGADEEPRKVRVGAIVARSGARATSASFDCKSSASVMIRIENEEETESSSSRHG